MKAGLHHCRAHGLRKAGATICAENDTTENQLKAIFGWENAMGGEPLYSASTAETDRDERDAAAGSRRNRERIDTPEKGDVSRSDTPFRYLSYSRPDF